MNTLGRLLIVLPLALFIFCPYNASAQEETTIYLTGNTGTASDNQVLSAIASKKGKNQILLLLGNMVGKNGQKNTVDLKDQMATWNSFDGKVIAIPGMYESYPEGHKSVDKTEKRIQKNSKAKFYPNDGCPLKKVDLTDEIVLIVIDSQWFLEDWDHYPYINNNCEIKNRNLFFLEFESLLKKAVGKTKIVAVHHPIATNTGAGLLSKTAGPSIQDYQNKQYRTLRKRLTTLAQQVDDVFFVSGRDKNLQLISYHGIPQIISGSTQSTKRVRAKKAGDFAAAKKGFGKLIIDGKGGASIAFYEVNNKSEDLLFAEILSERRIKRTFANSSYAPKSSFGTTKKASVYKPEETTKSKLYKGLWGAHYREFYGREIEAPVVFLDTLKGGLTPTRIGGGHQTKSLRLEDRNGKDFTLRALKKSGVRFLQSTAFQDSYIVDKLKGSFVDRFILDFYTTAHPYTPFVVSGLAESVGIYHTNPQLYYVPKQDALGEFNSEYGDELYMIEERVEPSQRKVTSFGNPDNILSTDEVFEELVKTGRANIDEPSYIRARIFDMLIGDWDRHEDQWRWAEFKNPDGSKTIKPIPRDRDQAFSVFDGSIISFLTCAIPDLRKMQSYDADLPSPKWFNFETYYLDLNFVNKSDWSEWEKQAKFLQAQLTDKAIDEAFKALPNEVRGQKIEDIKSKLKGRRANIVNLIKKYYDHYAKFEIVLGSNKSDSFLITRLPEGRTKIEVRNDHGPIYERILSKDETKEVWVYGLEGKDEFKVEGKGNRLIPLKIVGGENNDTYDFHNKKMVKLFDYQSKKNSVVQRGSRKRLVDDYDVNNYDHKKVKEHVNQFFPLLSFNPDDGVRIGFLNKYSVNGIHRNPFTQEHQISASYYTGTSGVDFSYKGEFANLFHNWNFAVEGWYTSPNFAMNFFGVGNETEYDKDLVDLDFNRTRIQKIGFAPSIVWRGRNGGSLFLKSMYESFEVENTQDRFINLLPGDSSVFDRQHYLGGEIGYQFENKNDASFPTLGFEMDFTAGYKTYIGDIDSIENEFGYLASSIGLDFGLVPSGNLVLATEIGGKAILGDNFEFYHGATLGGVHSLRGFRNERFNGKYAYYQNTDLRIRLGKLKTSFIPLKYGFTGGFDYGRVWVEDDSSDQWHNSYGASFWVGGLDAFTLNLGYYNSTDGGRVVFVFGFAF
ncbi:MAG: metallophosphatase [Bacteroidota bacterium]